MTSARTYRMTVLVMASILMLTTGTLALAKSLPGEPSDPILAPQTEVTESRPGVIPTIDPDSDLPTRPSVPTPTPHPARQTPVPTLDNPLGGPTAVPISTEPIEPPPTVIAPNPQPVQPTTPPSTQPTPTPDPNATATLSFSAMLCDPDWEGYDLITDDDGTIISVPRPWAEWDQQCPQPMGPVTFQVFKDWSNSGQMQGRQLIQSEDNLATFTVPSGTTLIAMPTPGRFWARSVWCTSSLRSEPWQLMSTGGKVGYKVIQLQPGEEAHCIRYFLAPSGTASLVITMHTCAAGYSPQAANADPLTDCAPGFAGSPLRLYDDRGSLPISGWPEGSDPASVTFGMLSAATYTVGVPALTPSFTIGCHATQPLMMGPSQTIVLTEGESRSCDWFVVPFH